MSTRYTIVVAESDDVFRNQLVSALDGADRRVVAVDDGWELMDYLEHALVPGHERRRPDLVLADIEIDGASGLEVVSWARAAGLECPFLLLTGDAHEQVFRAAKQLGHTAVLPKPQAPETIGGVAKAVLRRA